MEQVWKVSGRGRNEYFFEGERVNFCPAFINKFHFIYAARRYVIINNWPRGYLSCISTAQVARELIKFDTLQGEFRIDYKGRGLWGVLPVFLG